MAKKFMFFNFRSPYAYVGIKKALELNIKLNLYPFVMFQKRYWKQLH